VVHLTPIDEYCSVRKQLVQATPQLFLVPFDHE